MWPKNLLKIFILHASTVRHAHALVEWLGIKINVWIAGMNSNLCWACSSKSHSLIIMIVNFVQCSLGEPTQKLFINYNCYHFIRKMIKMPKLGKYFVTFWSTIKVNQIKTLPIPDDATSVRNELTYHMCAHHNLKLLSCSKH